MTDSEAGQAICLETGIREPVARGPTKNTECRGRGRRISRAVEQSKYKSMFWGTQKPGFEFWPCKTYCVILHKLLNLFELTPFIDKIKTDIMRLLEERN